MYLAGVPILGGVAVLLGRTTSALTLVLYGLAATRWVELEEVVLRHRFGAEWEDYQVAVRR